MTPHPSDDRCSCALRTDDDGTTVLYDTQNDDAWLRTDTTRSLVWST